jgi:membrane-associated phospholipid phosphatase
MNEGLPWTKRELDIIVRLQRAASKGRGVQAARVASYFGEHSIGWLATAGGLAVVDTKRRGIWARAGVAAFGAHVAAVAIKRVVRRPRPDSEAVVVSVAYPSRLSFPSAHAASTSAFALTCSPVISVPGAATLATAMCVSRVLVGAHYPSDVAAGAALGAASAFALGQLWRRRP